MQPSSRHCPTLIACISLRLVATGVGEVDADRCVRLCNGVIRSSDMFLPPEALESRFRTRRVPLEPPHPPWVLPALLSSAWGSSIAPCGHPGESSGGGHLSLSISSSFTMVGQGGPELELKFFKVS